MKKIPCSGPDCDKRRVHHERQDEMRPRQMVEVPDDYDGKTYCSLTCAVIDGAISFKPNYADPELWRKNVLNPQEKLPCGCHCEGGCGDPYAACMHPCAEHIGF